MEDDEKAHLALMEPVKEAEASAKKEDERKHKFASSQVSSGQVLFLEPSFIY